MIGESGYKRLANDAYDTPEWITRVLLDTVEFDGPVLEPAAGCGRMTDVLKEKHKVTSYDIMPRRKDISKKDFFKIKSTNFNIITNPPYAESDRFVAHALKLCKKKVAMLLRNEFDCAKKRTGFFENNPYYHMKIVLLKRPRWFAEEGASPRHNFAWYVWDHERKKKSADIVYRA